MNRDAPQSYLARLRALPFVTDATVIDGTVGETRVLLLEAPSVSQSFTLREVHSNLTKAELELWAGRLRTLPGDQPLVLFAPYVSAPMSARLRALGIRYVDGVGNVSLWIDGPSGPHHVALLEGNVPARASAGERAWRAQSYQVLFALLVQPALLHAPVRELANAAGVSTSPVLQVRDKLVHMDLVVQSGRKTQWTPRALQTAREFWLRGYQSTLRPHLLIQRYRPRQAGDVQALEEEIALRLDKRFSWRWGGAAASSRLDGYYRGDTTVVHIDALGVSRNDLNAALRMIPDPAGPVILLRRPGPLAFELGSAHVKLTPLRDNPSAPIVRTLQPDVVHPLLAWAELLEEAHDRASEAANELATRFFAEPDHAGA